MVSSIGILSTTIHRYAAQPDTAIINFTTCVCVQAVPENLNMAKMSLSPSASEKLSEPEKDEDRNGIFVPLLNNLIYTDPLQFYIKIVLWLITCLSSGNSEEGPNVEMLSVSPKANPGLSQYCAYLVNST